MISPGSVHSIRPLSILLFGILLCCRPAVLAGEDSTLAPVRRIVLISCDTLSARHLALYGYDKPTSATLDSLAPWGVLFRRCLVPQGWTLSSHMSMLTGLSPGVHRVGKNHALAQDIPLLPEILDSHGYAVAGFLGVNQWMAPEYGFGRGFLTYEFHTLHDPTRKWGYRWLKSQLPQPDDPRTGKPFFLFFHFMEPHSRPLSSDYLMPYWALKGIYHYYLGLPDIPPPISLTPDGKQWDMTAYDPSILRGGYDACIRYWDHERLRSLLGYLRAEGLLRDSLLIVTSDHGEEIAEHGGYFHDSPYAEVREVPLLMIMLGRLPAGMVVDIPVSVMDITPTVLDLAELPQPETCQGISLRPLWEESDAFFPRRDFLIDGHRRGHSLQSSALVGQADGTWWSLIAATDTTGSHGTYHPDRVDSLLGLYNLDEDPGETRNLLDSHPELAAQLRQRLSAAFSTDAALAERLGSGAEEDEMEISAEAERQLRALGY